MLDNLLGAVIVTSSDRDNLGVSERARLDISDK